MTRVSARNKILKALYGSPMSDQELWDEIETAMTFDESLPRTIPALEHLERMRNIINAIKVAAAAGTALPNEYAHYHNVLEMYAGKEIDGNYS